MGNKSKFLVTVEVKLSTAVEVEAATRQLAVSETLDNWHHTDWQPFDFGSDCQVDSFSVTDVSAVVYHGPELQTGAVRMIYEDPDTEQHPEGLAVLIREVSKGHGMDCWQVVFKDEDAIVSRWIRTEGQ